MIAESSKCMEERENREKKEEEEDKRGNIIVH